MNDNALNMHQTKLKWNIYNTSSEAISITHHFAMKLRPNFPVKISTEVFTLKNNNNNQPL